MIYIVYMETNTPPTNARNTKEHTMKINGKNVNTLTDAELEYAAQDLREVIEIQVKFEAAGLHVPKLERYRNELLTIGSEQHKRS